MKYIKAQEADRAAEKVLGWIIIILGKLSYSMKIRFFLVLGRRKPIYKRYRPAYRQAGLNLSQLAHLLLRSGIPIDLCYGRKMLTFPEKVIVKAKTVFYIIADSLFIPSRKEVSRRREG